MIIKIPFIAAKIIAVGVSICLARLTPSGSWPKNNDNEIVKRNNIIGNANCLSFFIIGGF